MLRLINQCLETEPVECNVVVLFLSSPNPTLVTPLVVPLQHPQPQEKRKVGVLMWGSHFPG